MATNNSILTETKKLLGIAEDYDVFDTDITIHINSALSTLTQLGIGPQKGFVIEDESAVWDDFLQGNNLKYASIKSYVYLRVRLIFDPPATSYTIDAFKEQIKELEWRLNVERESTDWVFDSMGDPGTFLDVTAGLPLSRRIRVKDGKNIWSSLNLFEAKMQVRESNSSDSLLILDMKPYLSVVFDNNDIVINLNMSGKETRQVRAGYYALVLSDVGDDDVQGIPVLQGYIRVQDLIVTSEVGS